MEIPAVPAGCGAGPVNALATMEAGPTFDRAYADIAYQINGNIIALANMGAQRANDPSLRKFSEKVVNERLDMNKKLALWYPQFAPGCSLALNADQAQSVTSGLECLTCEQFDREYVSRLKGLMEQSFRVASEGTTKISFGGLKDQANIVRRTNYNEIQALTNWENTGVLRR